MQGVPLCNIYLFIKLKAICRQQEKAEKGQFIAARFMCFLAVQMKSKCLKKFCSKRIEAIVRPSCLTLIGLFKKKNGFGVVQAQELVGHEVSLFCCISVGSR